MSGSRFGFSLVAALAEYVGPDGAPQEFFQPAGGRPGGGDLRFEISDLRFEIGYLHYGRDRGAPVAFEERREERREVRGVEDHVIALFDEPADERRRAGVRGRGECVKPERAHAGDDLRAADGRHTTSRSDSRFWI